MAVTMRTIRKLTGLLLVGMLIYVGWLLSKVDKPPTVEVKEQRADAKDMPAAPRDEMGCFDDLVADWAGDRLEAARACKRADGWLQLERVTLHVRNDDGSPRMLVSADRGLASDESGKPIELTGNVHVETPEGLRLDGEELSVDTALENVRSEKPVTFSHGDLSGEAGRLSHDGKSGRTQLEVQPMVRISGERTKGRDVTLIGQRLDHDQAARRLVANGAAILEFPEGSIEGSVIDVELAENGEDVETIVATGPAVTKTEMAARSPDGSPGPAMSRVLRGQRIEHGFSAGGVLDLVRAQGGARLEGASMGGGGISELLEGDSLEMDFSGSPLTLQGIHAVGMPARFTRSEPGATREVRGNDLRLASAKGSFDRLIVRGAADVKDETTALLRTLVADEADIGFAAGGEALESLEFKGRPGRLTETERDTNVRRQVVARDGALGFDAAGKPISGTLTGKVEITRGDTRASAESATLLQEPQRTVLRGDAAVERLGRTSHGDEITIDEVSQVLTVVGNQHTIVRDASSMPGMASTKSDEPILVASDTLVLREADRKALYQGGRPSLRRGDTELVADRLDMDDVAGSLDASGTVTSQLRLAKPGEAKQASESPFDPTRLVDGSAETFQYRRAERRVTYLGGAVLEQEDTVLEADRVDIFMTATEPAEVERLEATGNVFFRAPIRGEAEGDRLVWRAADDSVVVHGGERPARAVDANGNFQTGAVVAMTQGGVRALASPAGRARGSSPALAPQVVPPTSARTTQP